MAGRHEPESKGSFYLSVATATLRAGLVIAAVVLGIVVLSKAFPSADTGGETPQGQPSPVIPTTAPPESPTAGPSPDVPSPEESPEVAGVAIQVQNGTNETGFAAESAEQLEGLGYVVESVGNAARNYEQSTLFFRRDSRAEAEHLNATFFGGTAAMERIQGDQNPDIRIIVVLGLDFVGAPEA